MKVFLTALGLPTLRHSPVIMLMENIVISLFPSKSLPVVVPALSLPDQHKHFNALAPALAACQGRDSAKGRLYQRAASLGPAALDKVQVQIISAIATPLLTGSCPGEQLRDRPTCSLTAPWD